MKSKPFCLPREARQLLAPFFPGFDLERVRIHEYIPWYVLGRPQGYASCYNVYLEPGAYCIDSIEGLVLLAHEITHCLQYRKLGTWRFRAHYLGSYFRNRWRGMPRSMAYLNIPFEIEARKVESEVYWTLQKLQSKAAQSGKHVTEQFIFCDTEVTARQSRGTR
jgi:Domain of unknown function (DUF4157)